MTYWSGNGPCPTNFPQFNMDYSSDSCPSPERQPLSSPCPAESSISSLSPAYERYGNVDSSCDSPASQASSGAYKSYGYFDDSYPCPEEQHSSGGYRGYSQPSPPSPLPQFGAEGHHYQSSPCAEPSPPGYDPEMQYVDDPFSFQSDDSVYEGVDQCMESGGHYEESLAAAEATEPYHPPQVYANMVAAGQGRPYGAKDFNLDPGMKFVDAQKYLDRIHTCRRQDAGYNQKWDRLDFPSPPPRQPLRSDSFDPRTLYPDSPQHYEMETAFDSTCEEMETAIDTTGDSEATGFTFNTAIDDPSAFKQQPTYDWLWGGGAKCPSPSSGRSPGIPATTTRPSPSPRRPRPRQPRSSDFY